MDFRSQTNLPRGIRNNNPGNIKTGQGWKGVVGNDGTFDIFSDDTWGLRALAMDLSTKINTDGLNTIRLIISTYAPPSENDTDAYISAVSSGSGIGPDDQLGTDQDTLHSLMRPIVDRENGAQGALVTDADIDTGISMMGNNPAVLVQSAVAAVANNTDNAAFIFVGAVVGIVLLINSYRRK